MRLGRNGEDDAYARRNRSNSGVYVLGGVNSMTTVLEVEHRVAAYHTLQPSQLHRKTPCVGVLPPWQHNCLSECRSEEYDKGLMSPNRGMRNI